MMPVALSSPGERKRERLATMLKLYMYKPGLSMAKSLSQALSRTAGARLLPSRNRSTSPEPPAIYHGYKVDPDSDADGASRRMEDAVHRIIIKRSQPNWISFRPGSSYWVPPNTKSCQFACVSAKSPNSVTDHFFKGEAPSTSSKRNTTQSEEEEES